MNWIKKTYRSVRNRLFSKTLIHYREVEDYKCKFCKKVFWHSFYKDICQNCIRRGIEWAIRRSHE